MKKFDQYVWEYELPTDKKVELILMELKNTLLRIDYDYRRVCSTRAAKRVTT